MIHVPSNLNACINKIFIIIAITQIIRNSTPLRHCWVHRLPPWPSSSIVKSYSPSESLSDQCLPLRPACCARANSARIIAALLICALRMRMSSCGSLVSHSSITSLLDACASKSVSKCHQTPRSLRVRQEPRQKQPFLCHKAT